MKFIFALLFLLTSAVALLPAADQWEPAIAKFEQDDRQTPPPKDAVLFVGSSSIRLWTTLAQDFAGTPVINRGFGGSRIPEVTQYVDRIVWPYNPRLIAFYAGDNDIASKMAPATLLENYKAFVSKVREKLPQTPIIFLSIKPSVARASMLPAQVEANTLIRDYISTDKSQSFVDVATPLLAANGQPNPELFVQDGIHMKPEGYVLWTDILRPIITKSN